MLNVRFSGLLLAALSVGAAGCASHSDYTKAARSALDAGQTNDALTRYNEALDVPNAKQLPPKIGGDNVLFILDRAMVLQSLKNYELSERDLSVADKQIEVLDFSRSSLDDIGKYVFSDSTGPYKAPIYEKLLINTMNMVNYLAQHDLEGARVEARRLAVMQRFVKDTKGSSAALIAPGSYLAGFIFEKSNDPDEALRYYDEALAQQPFGSLEPAVVRLAQKSSYRTPRIDAILKKYAAQAEPSSAATPPPNNPNNSASTATASPATPAIAAADQPAEVLVVISYGRVPAKIAKRVPIGLALTFASGALSPYDQARANRLAAQGLVTWVNFPELGQPRGEWGSAHLAVDGSSRVIEQALAVDLEAKKAWDDIKGSVVASAITRLITRLVAGEVADKASGGGTLGTILSLVTQATLTATDTPDTRSWSTLPARITVARFTIPAGTHWVDLGARGRSERYKITVRPGDWALLGLTVLR
ncbi:MAG TPA: hypothetical protein VL137_16750 [Polyangiaceae bacterium]|nr:hypothetical protein [Polyangiaceae bacterium]